MKTLGLLSVLLLLSGCPGPGPNFDAGTLPDGGACPLSLELGTEVLPSDGGFQREFSSLADGGSAEIIFGPQGGRHVWVSVRASGLPRTGTLTWVLRSGGVQLGTPLELVLTRTASGYEAIPCGWERRSDAYVLSDTAGVTTGVTAELDATWSQFGSAPIVSKVNAELR